MTPFFYNEENLSSDVKRSGFRSTDQVTPPVDGTAALALVAGGAALLANRSPSASKTTPGEVVVNDSEISDLIEDALDVVRVPAVYSDVNKWHAASIMHPIVKVGNISEAQAGIFFKWKDLADDVPLKDALTKDVQDHSYGFALHTGTVEYATGSNNQVRKLIADDWINGNIAQSSWQLVSESGKEIQFLLMGILFSFLPSLLPKSKFQLRCPVIFKVCGLIDKRMRHSDTSMQGISGSIASGTLREIVRVQNGSKALEYMALHVADGVTEGPINFATGDTFPNVTSERRGVLHTTDIVSTTVFNPSSPLVDSTNNGAVDNDDFVRYVEHYMIGYFEGPQSIWEGRTASSSDPSSVSPKRVMTLTGAEMSQNRFNNFGLGVLRRFSNTSTTNNSTQWGNVIPARTTAMVGASVPGVLSDTSVQKASQQLKGWLRSSDSHKKWTFIPDTGTTREEQNVSFWQFHLGLGSKVTDCTLVRWNKNGAGNTVFLGTAKAKILSVAQTGGGVAYAPVLTLEFEESVVVATHVIYTLILYPASVKQMIYDKIGKHLDRGYTNQNITLGTNLLQFLYAGNNVAKAQAQESFIKNFGSNVTYARYATLK